MKIFTALHSALLSGSLTVMATVVKSAGRVDLIGKKVLFSDPEMVGGADKRSMPEDLVTVLSPHLKTGRSGLVAIDTIAHGKLKIFVHAFFPQPRLIIFGGGHVGGALCNMAALLDYRIILIDDRPTFAAADRHPAAHELICEQFEKAFEQIEPSPADYMVIVTRGHRHDRLCLEKCLTRQAAYIGMIGSRKRVQAQLQELAQAGFSNEQLDQVHAPIGLPIGAVTEPEIAVSILAEITSVRRQTGKEETARLEVLDELHRLEKSGEKAVLVTIVATSGSTPRKTGSQMIVYPDGSLKGTIGGGCSEADARRDALLQLEAGRPALFSHRLTADAAAEGGMACGGIMDLFFEPLPVD